MEPASDRYYRNSGAVPLGGTALMLACGGAAAVLASLLYSALAYYVPYVEARIILPFALGGAVGGAVRFGAVQGHVRNRLFAFLTTIVLALLALYAAWVWFLWIAWGLLIVEPGELAREIQGLAVAGPWEFFGNWRPTGWQIYALWSAETAAVVLTAVLVGSTHETPYCERCRRWMEKSAADPVFALTDPERLRTDLEEERYEVLEPLRRMPIDTNDCLRATIHECPACGDSNCLTISRVLIVVKNGELQPQATVLVDKLWIPEDIARGLAEPVEVAEAVVLLPEVEPTAQS